MISEEIIVTSWNQHSNGAGSKNEQSILSSSYCPKHPSATCSLMSITSFSTGWSGCPHQQDIWCSLLPPAHCPCHRLPSSTVFPRVIKQLVATKDLTCFPGLWPWNVRRVATENNTGESEKPRIISKASTQGIKQHFPGKSGHPFMLNIRLFSSV